MLIKLKTNECILVKTDLLDFCRKNLDSGYGLYDYHNQPHAFIDKIRMNDRSTTRVIYARIGDKLIDFINDTIYDI